MSSRKLLAALLALLSFVIFQSHAQTANREYASLTPLHFKSGAATVTAANEAADQDETPAYVSVRDNGTQASIQLRYDNDVSANTTTFVKIGNPQLESGYDVEASILTPLLGILIAAEAYNGATLVNNSNVQVELITDVSDNWFLAVTSAVKYDAVRVYLKYISKVGPYNTGTGYSMSVFYAFHLKAVNDDCGGVWATNAGIGKINGSQFSETIKDRNNAVDNSTNTSATLQTISGETTVSQTIYFNSESNHKDEQVKILFSIPSTVLADVIFDKITFQVFNGGVAAGASYTLRSRMTGDRMGQCSGNRQVVIGIPSGNKFDRIRISATETKINIYQVVRVAKSPELVSAAGKICEDGSFSFKLKNDPRVSFSWYDKNKAKIPGTESLQQYSVSDLEPGLHTFYVSATQIGCTEATPLVPATLIVYPKPGPPSVQLQ
ncbi:MAG TPA: hypothetical protein VGE26_03585 [Sphingobacteriaceae bacterium]